VEEGVGMPFGGKQGAGVKVQKQKVLPEPWAAKWALMFI